MRLSERRRDLNMNKAVMQIMNDRETPMLKRVESLETAMLKLPQSEIPVRNFEGDNIYAREIEVPAGTFLTGGLHKYDHISILVKGKLLYWTLDDDEASILNGYSVNITKAGTKRVVYVLEDSIWITSHHVPGNDRTAEDARAYLTAVSYEEYVKFKEENSSTFEGVSSRETDEVGLPENGLLSAPSRDV